MLSFLVEVNELGLRVSVIILNHRERHGSRTIKCRETESFVASFDRYQVMAKETLPLIVSICEIIDFF